VIPALRSSYGVINMSKSGELNPRGNQPIRIMVVDDSLFFRTSLVKMLEKESNIKVVAEAGDGEDALRRLPYLQPAPDLIIMDVFMPRKDGLATLEEITAKYTIPVIMLSSTTSEDSAISVSALLRGAFDVIAKPHAETGLQGIRTELLNKIKAATMNQSLSRLTNTTSLLSERPTNPLPVEAGRAGRPTTAPLPRLREIEAGRPDRLVVIGASTGGPRALYELLPKLQPLVSTAFIVVQHMPAHLTGDFTRRLGAVVKLPVQEAVGHELLERGTIYIAPGDYHLNLTADYRLSLNKAPKLNGVRPSLDVTLLSAVNLYGSRIMAVVLTGMGRDGLLGSGMLKRTGGLVLVEHESTCVVYGMPKEVFDAGYAAGAYPLPQLADHINRFTR
jgi:two-component system chemotaxis response regulator CheB